MNRFPNEKKYRIEIHSCHFPDLDIDDMLAKLELIRKLKLNEFYRIIEEPPAPENDLVETKVEIKT
jgi:hypothetical protein